MSKVQLYEKINRVMDKAGKMHKDGEIKDKAGKKMYSYLSEEQTTSTLQKLFVEEKLVLFPVEVEEEFFYIEGFKYDKAFKNPVTKIKVKYKIVDAETGEFETLHSIGYGTDDADKGSNKAMTNAFKYVQRQTFMIASGEDSDHTPSSEHTDKHAVPDKTPTQPYQEKDAPNVGRQPAVSNTKTTGGQTPQSRVYKLREEMGWAWNDLSEFAADVLQREVKFLKSDVKTEDEWLSIEKAILVTKSASVGA